MAKSQLLRFPRLSAFCRHFSDKITMPLSAWQGEAQVLSEKELKSIEENILLRQSKNNVPLIRNLIERLENDSTNADIQSRLAAELKRLPNAIHHRLEGYGNEPRELLKFTPTKQNTKAKEFSEICKRLNLLRTDHLGNYTGHKSYYLAGALASMEQALIQYALVSLKKNGFQLVSVPDILPCAIIEGCGMQTAGERTQVYKLDSGKCLSGTSEMALAGFFSDRVLNENELPIKVVAASRCYRAETSGLHEEKGIYRVHQFSKVEMFAICSEAQSEAILESFKDIQVSLYQTLEIPFRLLDMPPCELGAPAYQKYDIEAWMPGRQMWGEISSCSNCTDYQSKRLNIRYRSADNQLRYAHSVNGTAAAIPRLLISLVESNQIEDGVISVPQALRNFIKKNEIRKERNMPDIKLVKTIKSLL